MNIADLKKGLVEAGCNPDSYAVGLRKGVSDAFCLTHDGQEWLVYYTERGVDEAPIYRSTIEAEACVYFHRLITGLRHDHCVGFFADETAAIALQQQLTAHGIAAWQDTIPYGGPQNPRYRVFVTGKAIFPTKDLLGPLPVHD